jgi:hypothetical protein
MLNRSEQWAETQVNYCVGNICGLIDCGMPKQEAIKITMDNSILGKEYTEQVKEAVKDYVHLHKMVKDVITGKNWCLTCQKFE